MCMIILHYFSVHREPRMTHLHILGFTIDRLHRKGTLTNDVLYIYYIVNNFVLFRRQILKN